MASARIHLNYGVTRNSRLRNIGHSAIKYISVTGIEILGLHHRDLNRQRHEHLPTHYRIIHILIMSKNRNHKGRKLVRCPEVKRNDSILRRIQERLERQRCREVAPERNLRNRSLLAWTGRHHSIFHSIRFRKRSTRSIYSA